MSFTTKTGRLFCSAATVMGAVGFLSVPTAHAEDSCTVDGPYLDLRNDQWDYQSMSIQVNGTEFGPGVVTSASGENPTYGKVTDSRFSGRSIAITITWNDNKGTAIYGAAVGDDGFAHGTASGPNIPVNLWTPGPWHSTTHITCKAAGDNTPAPGGHVLTGDVQLWSKPGGPDAGAVLSGELKKGDAVTLNGPCPIVKPGDATDGWCAITDTTRHKTGAVWGDFVSK